MVSFSGMAEMLGWESRLPITAPSDRARVLALWSRDGGRERSLREHARRFQRQSSRPRLRNVGGDGRQGGGDRGNYRFGYKAAGDVEDLKTFGAENGMTVNVADLVPAQTKVGDGIGRPGE